MKHKIVIVASKKDLASFNIGSKILEIGNFEKVENICPYETYQKDDNYLVWHDKGLVEEDITDLDDYFNPELYIYKRTRLFIESVAYTGNEKINTCIITLVLPSVYDDSTPINIFN